MGQGWLARSPIGCLLLIVSAIQGITPDPHDLASPLAITIVGSSLIGRDAQPDDDLVQGLTCVAGPDCERPGAHRPSAPTRTGFVANTGRDPHHPPRHAGPGSGLLASRPVGDDLPRRLCRLTC